MDSIWFLMIAASIAYAFPAGNTGQVTGALLNCGSRAISVMITLAASMMLWSGLMEILSQTGDISRIGRAFRRCARGLFPGIEDEECWSALSMNMAANLFGMGNAATPAGIKAAALLMKHGEAGIRSLAMMLVINNAGLQLIPSTVLALRHAAGSENPADIWLPTIITSGAALVVGVTAMLLLQWGGKRAERSGRSHRADPGNVYPSEGEKSGH